MRQLTGYGARIQPGPPVPHVAVPHSNSIRTRCSTGSTQTSLDPTQTLLRTIPRTVTPLPQHVQRVEKMGHESYVAPHPDLWRQDPVLMSGCEADGPRLRVAVLLSGGVDSSLALRLLLAAGHEVKAFYLQIWFQEDFRNFWDECPWEEDLWYARDVCDSLGVELEVVPMTTQYWERVVAHSVGEIRAGRTPNPDVLCNSRVKFGAFLDGLGARPELAGFDRVASGHYARVVRVPSQQLAAVGGQQAGGSGGSSSSEGEPEARLALTPDAVKDQTYFLAALSPKQLGAAMFPLGGLTKPQVRALAAAAGLATQARKDSQGICFLGKVKFPEFVKEHLGEWPGLIVEDEEQSEPAASSSNSSGSPDAAAGVPAGGNGVGGKERKGVTEKGAHGAASGSGEQKGVTEKNVHKAASESGSGRGGRAPTVAMFGRRRVLGAHAGYWFYTVGQRGGIKLPGGPWYVVRKDTRLNIIYVSRAYNEAAHHRPRNLFIAGPFTWLSPHLRPDTRQGAAQLYVKVRHGPHAYRCELRQLPPPPSGVLAASSTCKPDSSSSRSDGCGSSSSSSSSTSGAAASGSFPIATSSSGSGSSCTEPQPQTVQPCEWDGGALVVLDGVDQGLAAGQYAVLYQGGFCLGAAVIQEFDATALGFGSGKGGSGDCGHLEPYAGPNATGRHVVLTAAGEEEA